MDSREFIIVEKDPEIRRRFLYSLVKKVNTNLGICEQIRFVYDDVYQLPDSDIKKRITERLVDALIMAKKMNDRLVWYRKKYNKDYTGHGGANLIPLQNNHWRMRMRMARKI